MIYRNTFAPRNPRRAFDRLLRWWRFHARRRLWGRDLLSESCGFDADMVESYLEEVREMSEGKPSWQNRRRHERFRSNLPVQVKVWAGGEPQQGTCLDLSQGGLLAEVDELLPQGTRVLVELKVYPTGKLLCVPAEVAWGLDSPSETHTRPSMGLRFSELEEKDETLLSETIERLARRR